ncbi:expressed unknown protein [Seminavis robusta]|uniref:Uncharacterized protein n=1 Tax=Seminavis robusta TaxID=568900 RepID=A0A9N8ENR4_9STRA|nr:expressed unknown protein [Seminavis robusta]|eukprot:Sro1487_g276770.1 n/a (530) ;mRNA; f:14014-15603
MFASMSKNKDENNNGSDKGKKRFNMISIPQKFEWTGISSIISQDNNKHHHNNKPTDADTDTDDILTIMEGLILWNVLGFALADTKDYVCFSAVNKEWNQVVRTLVPPVMYQIKAVLDHNNNNKSRDELILQVKDLELLTAVLEMVPDKDSAIYRQDNRRQHLEWPHLQPPFAMIVMRFVFAASTKRNKFSSNMYEMVCCFLEKISIQTAHQMIKTFYNNNSNTANILENLVQLWVTWEGMVGIVEAIAGHLSRYYAAQNSLLSLTQHARHCFVAVLLSGPEFPYGLAELLGHMQGTKVLNNMPRDLVLRAYHASIAIASFPTELQQHWDQVGGFGVILQAYNQIKAQVEESILPSEEEEEEEEEEQIAQVVGQPQHQEEEEKANFHLTLMFPNGTKLNALHHFVESSILLKNMHFANGDAIRWHGDEDIPHFVKALVFYALDEKTPMPPTFPAPLPHGVHLTSILGAENAQFARLVEPHSAQELLVLIHFCSFLNLEKLATLCGMAIALKIREMNPAELRTINLTRINE